MTLVETVNEVLTSLVLESVEQESGKWDKPHLKEGFLPLYQYLECFVIYITTQISQWHLQYWHLQRGNWRCKTSPASLTSILKSLITSSHSWS